MTNGRIFIGWSGIENQEIAQIMSALLKNNGYVPVIGGEWRTAFTVSEEIIHQMNGCNFGIFLIEKEKRVRENGDVISVGFNPNVMMELGYMLHKVSDPNRIRRILINVRPDELPSDLQGTWTDEVKKDSYPEGDEGARRKALEKIAKQIVDKFLKYMKAYQNTDKLDYFDNWEENRVDIYNFTGDMRIADKLIYGMQMEIYSGYFGRFYDALSNIKVQLTQSDRFKDYSAVACAMAILNVFVETKRLTEGLSDSRFARLSEDLECEYEKDIADRELKAWCKIFRHDKLELCYELCARAQENPEVKKDYYDEALRLCHQLIGMIDEQVNKTDGEDGTCSKRDENYALIYKAFISRNISQIHKHLAELEPEKKDEHREKQKEYCKITYQYRKALYNYYKSSTRESSLTMDFITQEYFLALVEQYEFEENSIEKRKIKTIAGTIYEKLQDRAKIQNMILRAVEAHTDKFLD